MTSSGLESRRGEQTYAVEGLLSHGVHLNLKIAELVLVSRIVEVVLHDVLTHSLEFDHSVDDPTGGLQDTVLDLEERNPVLYIVVRSVETIDRTAPLHRTRKPSGRVRRAMDPFRWIADYALLQRIRMRDKLKPA